MKPDHASEDTIQKQPPAPVTGLAHFLAAARYSRDGSRRLLRETAARQELVLGTSAILLLIYAGASLPQIAAFAILFAVLLAVEALNTAIEVLTNRVSPEWSLEAKHAKDLGSLAVALLIGSNVLCFAVILLPILF